MMVDKGESVDAKIKHLDMQLNEIRKNRKDIAHLSSPSRLQNQLDHLDLSYVPGMQESFDGPIDFSKSFNGSHAPYTPPPLGASSRHPSVPRIFQTEFVIKHNNRARLRESYNSRKRRDVLSKWMPNLKNENSPLKMNDLSSHSKENRNNMSFEDSPIPFPNLSKSISFSSAGDAETAEIHDGLIDVGKEIAKEEMKTEFLSRITHSQQTEELVQDIQTEISNLQRKFNSIAYQLEHHDKRHEESKVKAYELQQRVGFLEQDRSKNQSEFAQDSQINQEKVVFLEQTLRNIEYKTERLADDLLMYRKEQEKYKLTINELERSSISSYAQESFMQDVEMSLQNFEKDHVEHIRKNTSMLDSLLKEKSLFDEQVQGLFDKLKQMQEDHGRLKDRLVSFEDTYYEKLNHPMDDLTIGKKTSHKYLKGFSLVVFFLTIFLSYLLAYEGSEGNAAIY